MRKRRADLATIIERNGLKQIEIAASIGVAKETLNRWVRGHKRPTGDNLVRLLAHLRRFEPELQAEDLMASSGQARVA